MSRQNSEVAAVFASYPLPMRESLLELRSLIIETAAETEGVGPIEEGLRWGQPSYLTSESRSGSTIRIAPTVGNSSHDYAMFFICHTHLIETFKAMFGEVFVYDGNRGLLFSLGDPIPVAELRECVALALTYHLAGSDPK